MSAEAISRALERASRHVEDTTKKILHRMYLDETRQSMYAELKESIISSSVWARSYGIGDDLVPLDWMGPDVHVLCLCKTPLSSASVQNLAVSWPASPSCRERQNFRRMKAEHPQYSTAKLV